MWADSVDAVVAFGEFRSLVHAAKSIDALLSAAVCRARDAGVPVGLLASELDVNRSTLYRQFGRHAAVVS
ncbi:hypothetical protein BH10ACT2_BH10ACT2_11350 [soil metagenome]